MEFKSEGQGSVCGNLDPLETKDIFTLGKSTFQLLTTIQPNSHSDVYSRSLGIIAHDILMSA